jgi:protein O-mannosyl-transferase
MRRTLYASSIILLIILIFSAYCNTFLSPPILDDFHSFVREHKVHLDHFSFANLISISNSTFGWTRWIPMSSFAFDHWLGGGEIFYFHLTNTVIHILVMLSVIFLVFQLMTASGQNGITEEITAWQCALFVAGVWALCPIQTNAVTYLVQRMASIQALFYIAAISFYVKGRLKQIKTKAVKKAFIAYFLCLISCLGAFLSKENSAMLPFMILMTELWFFSPDILIHVIQKLKTGKWRVICLLVLGAILLLIFVVKGYSYSINGYSRRHFTLIERLLTESRIIVWYISLLLCPLPSRMSIEHDVILSKSLMNPPTTLLAVIMVAGIGILIVRYRRKFPIVTYGMLWFFANLAIESTFVPLELIFEHRLYLPSVGYYLSLVIGALFVGKKLLGKLPRAEFAKITWSFVAIILSCFTLLTFQRNEAWRDFVTINQDAASKAPNNHRAHANYAVALMRAGRYQEAIKEAELAIGLGQTHFESYMVASNAIIGSLGEMGSLEKAAEKGEELLANAPARFDAGAFPMVCLQLAETYRHLGRLDKAYAAAVMSFRTGTTNYYQERLVQDMLIKILSKAEEENIDLNGDDLTDPGSEGAKTWVAGDLLKYEKRNLAKELVNRALLDDPADLKAQQLVTALNAQETLDQNQVNRGNLSSSYVRRPFSRLNICIAAAYLIRKYSLPRFFMEIGEACLDYARELDPKNPDTCLLMGWYSHEKGETEKAVEMTKMALELDSDNSKAWLELGFLLINADQPAAAIDCFRKVLELYPGYPKKNVVLQIISDLEKGVGSLKAAKNSFDRS